MSIKSPVRHFTVGYETLDEVIAAKKVRVKSYEADIAAGRHIRWFLRATGNLLDEKSLGQLLDIGANTEPSDG